METGLCRGDGRFQLLVGVFLEALHKFAVEGIDALVAHGANMLRNALRGSGVKPDFSGWSRTRRFLGGHLRGVEGKIPSDPVEGR